MRLIPPDPDVDGYHWIRRWRGVPPIPLHWNATWHRNGGEGWGKYAQPDRETEWAYIAPCLMPVEVTS